MPDRRTILLSALLASAVAIAAGADGPQPESDGDGVPILFLPPPMDGTISLGIYDPAGKLVRILHREAVLQEFKVGENGLLTHWDGRDASGRRVAPGKYRAGGWMVGDLGVEGVAFHGNDWIKDESPRYTRVSAVKNVGRDEVHVTLQTLDGRHETLAWKLGREGVEPPRSEIEARVEEGQLIIREGAGLRPVPLGEGARAIEATAGRGDRVWVIVETSGAREVRAYSAGGDFLRRLAYGKDEPQPRQIAASLWEETIFLLDENETEQRLRALALGAAQAPASDPGAPDSQPASVSTWKITYFKRVLKSDSFDAVSAHLGRANPPKAEAVSKILARANPLLGGKDAGVPVTIAAEPGGAVLKAGDGLPLAGLTATPNLKWTALVREGDALLLFQSDGSVVEEFKISQPGNMMSFDAGEIEIGGAMEKSVPKRKRPLRPGDDL